MVNVKKLMMAVFGATALPGATAVNLGSQGCTVSNLNGEDTTQPNSFQDPNPKSSSNDDGNQLETISSFMESGQDGKVTQKERRKKYEGFGGVDNNILNHKGPRLVLQSMMQHQEVVKSQALDHQHHKKNAPEFFQGFPGPPTMHLNYTKMVRDYLRTAGPEPTVEGLRKAYADNADNATITGLQWYSTDILKKMKTHYEQYQQVVIDYFKTLTLDKGPTMGDLVKSPDNPFLKVLDQKELTRMKTHYDQMLHLEVMPGAKSGTIKNIKHEFDTNTHFIGNGFYYIPVFLRTPRKNAEEPLEKEFRGTVQGTKIELQDADRQDFTLSQPLFRRLDMNDDLINSFCKEFNEKYDPLLVKQQPLEQDVKKILTDDNKGVKKGEYYSSEFVRYIEWKFMDKILLTIQWFKDSEELRDLKTLRRCRRVYFYVQEGL